MRNIRSRQLVLKKIAGWFLLASPIVAVLTTLWVLSDTKTMVITIAIVVLIIGVIFIGTWLIEDD